MFSRISRSLLLTFGLSFLASHASAVIRDGGVDPANLGQGGWLYVISTSTNKLGNTVSTVTNMDSMFEYLKSQNLDFVIVKAGTSNKLWGTSGDVPIGSPQAQFTTNLVQSAHAHGLKIFGSNRSWGNDIPGEIAVANYVYQQGADGYIHDAEAEWESSRAWIGTNGPALAWQLCSTIRSNWPNKFMAHNPFDTAYLHFSFPFKEFGYWCDTVMPQVYHHTASKNNAIAAIHWNDYNYNKLNAYLASLAPSIIGGQTIYWTNAIKPLLLMRDVYNGNSSTPVHPASDVRNFTDYLVADPNAATPGGYQGANYFRSELHSAAQWANIKAATIGQSTNRVNNIVLDDAAATFVGAWDPIKTIDATTSTVLFTGETGTDTNSFGTNYWLTTKGVGDEYMEYAPNVLVPGEYKLYEWHPLRDDAATDVPFMINCSTGLTTITVDQTTNAGDWTFLGKFPFNAGTNGTIRIRDDFSDPFAVALVDGFKMVYVTPSNVVAPSSLTATAINAAQIDLAWTDNATNETGFVIGRSTSNSGPFADIATAGINSTNYSDKTCAAGTTYYYVVRGIAFVVSSTNTAVASATTPAGPPVIVRQPQSQTVLGGNTVFLDVGFGATSPAFQWQLNGANMPGATSSTLSIPNSTAANNGGYRVIVSGVGGSVTSDTATVQIQFSLTTTAMSGGSVTRELDSTTYAYNEVVTLAAIPDANYTFVGWSGDALATNNPIMVTMDRHKSITAHFMYSPELIVDNPQATFAGAWTVGTASGDKYGSSYHYVNTASTITAQAFYRPTIVTPGKYNVYISSPGGSSRTTNAQISVYYEGGTKNTNANQRPVNTNFVWRQVASGLDFAAGTTDYLRLANNTGETNKLVIADAARFALVIAPSIIIQPQGTTVPAQAPVTFGVLASGNNLLYQWQKNGANISGATATSYNIAAAQSTDQGSYTVVIRNEASTATSSTATLNVTIPPTSLQSFGFNSGQHFQFWLSAPAGNYLIQGSSNLVNWISLTNISSSGGPVLFIDSNSDDGLNHYYRAQAAP